MKEYLGCNPYRAIVYLNPALFSSQRRRAIYPNREAPHPPLLKTQHPPKLSDVGGLNFLSKHPLQSLALTAYLLRGGIYLAELHELVVILTTRLINERALQTDILRFRALKVSAVAHLAYEAESLCATGKTTNKRGGTLVLPELNFNSGACCHNGKTLAHLSNS